MATAETATAGTAVGAAMIKAAAAGGQHEGWGGDRDLGGLVEEADRGTLLVKGGEKPSTTMRARATVCREVEDLPDKPADEGAAGGGGEVETTRRGEREGNAKAPGVVGASMERERRKRGAVGFGDSMMTTMTTWWV